MKNILFLIALLNFSYLPAQSIFHFKPNKSNSELLKESYAIQAKIDTILSNLDSEDSNQKLVTNFLNNIKFGFYDSALYVHKDSILKSTLSKYNYDISELLELGKTNAINIEYLEATNSSEKTEKDNNISCKTNNFSYLKKDMRGMKLKSGEKILIVNGIFDELLKLISKKYKNLDIYITYLDSYAMQSNFIEYNYDPCFKKYKKENGHNYHIVDLKNYSPDFSKIIFDRIIFNRFYGYDLLKMFEPNMDKNTVIILNKYYTYKTKKNKIAVKPEKNDFENTIKELGYKIIKSKKFHDSFIQINKEDLFDSTETKSKGVRYTLIKEF
ncbi:MAG TPA: hypothetical protein ENK91_17050 [Bacteroidetes bacterium]|nr:hypothetical protein [Bacteroidota bacterium]